MHTPTLPGEEPPVAPDHVAGAWTNCECADCRELRLRDPERIAYTAHEMADAWRTGWHDGYARCLKATEARGG